MPIWLFRQIQGHGHITGIPTREEAAGGLDDIRISEVLGGIFADLSANIFLHCSNHNSLYLLSCSISLLNNLKHAPRSFSVVGRFAVRVPPWHQPSSVGLQPSPRLWLTGWLAGQFELFALSFRL
jgi:hypothetical protein